MANGHKNNITNMLGLKGFRVSDTREEDIVRILTTGMFPHYLK